jgi:hypothetical protein
MNPEAEGELAAFNGWDQIGAFATPDNNSLSALGRRVAQIKQMG